MSQTIEQAFAKTFQAWYEEGNFNGVVVVSKNGDITYKEAFGIANIETEAVLKTSSIFNLASVSKQFTAMCIMILYEQDALDFDDSITEYLTELPYQDITIRHLLHHTSGLPACEEIMEEYWEGDADSDFMTNEDLLEVYAENEFELDFEVGERYEYSNTGYAFLASIVERVSGETFEDFLQEHIFKPLGMRQSYGLRRPNTPPKPYAQGFCENDGEWEDYSFNYFDGIIGDGNVFCSAEDLAIYDKALTECALVSEETMAEAFTSGTLNDGENTDYGFGWEIESDEFVSHTGAWEGYNTYFGRDLAEGYAFIVLDNGDNPDIHEAIEEIMSNFYE
ncbi:MAG: class A beta-lactamase-related serine hydrolase [Bacteroidetes bacterium]|nr:MAG: class A beta-lactamase-related serine hydrolase [Bacteroidota bacterium]